MYSNCAIKQNKGQIVEQEELIEKECWTYTREKQGVLLSEGAKARPQRCGAQPDWSSGKRAEKALNSVLVQFSLCWSVCVCFAQILAVKMDSSQSDYEGLIMVDGKTGTVHICYS